MLKFAETAVGFDISDTYTNPKYPPKNNINSFLTPSKSTFSKNYVCNYHIFNKLRKCRKVGIKYHVIFSQDFALFCSAETARFWFIFPRNEVVYYSIEYNFIELNLDFLTLNCIIEV